MIEHKRCPTGKISQQQNQSQNSPVQNANTSHAAEACRLRASRRAGCTSQDVPVARRKTRCMVCASGDAPVCASGDAPGKRAGAHGVCASVRAEQARRCARSVRVGARGARSSARAEHARRRARSTRVGARVVGRRIRPFFSVGLSRSGAIVWVRWSGPVPRATACQPLAPGGAGHPPLR